MLFWNRAARVRRHDSEMPHMTPLLIIDDDRELCALLEEYLAREGFSTTLEHDGARGLEIAMNGEFALVVLDLMLPSLDGLALLKQLREKSRVPVLMLTARGEDVDRIVGLELGADDYLAKPFNPRELVARIRAILRRAQAPSKGRLEVNGVTIDPGSRSVMCDGREIEMTTLEFDILEVLMRSAGHVVSRDALMESMYNRKATPFDRSIDMHVSHLRKKLETGPTIIKTVRGIGYQFCLSRD
jgi:two-component system response regulator CpxR